MLDFRPKQPVGRNYLARGEQRRLLVLVLLLGFFAMAIGESARPERWQWLWHMTEGRERLAAIDTRVPGDDEGQPVAPPAATAKTAAPKWAAITAEEIAPLLDDAKVRNEERLGIYSILKKLGETAPDELQAASVGEVTYIQLYKQPGAYRGQVVSLVGEVRKATRIDAGNLAATTGVPAYYELWITPDDRPKEVVCVYCAELPEKFPLGDELDVPVRVQGVSLKRLAYQVKDREWHSTPLLAARAVQPLPKPVAAQVVDRAPPRWTTSLVVVVITLALALGVAAWAFTRRRKQHNPYSSAHLTPRRGLQFSDLRGLEVDPDVKAALDKLAKGPHDAGPS